MDELVKRLWECASGECFNCSQYTETTNASVCSKELMKQAADAIEELLSAAPPKLWTDEPITWTEFMTHTGSVGFEIHFRTPDVEKYKAVQEECRRQIDHAKPQPPKEE